MIYTITLNPALDYVMQIDKLSTDDINRSLSDAIYYGGKGINVSAILSRLSVENKALGFAAGFTGAELERMLIADGICCDFIHMKSGHTRINVKLRSDAELDINASGPVVSEGDITALLSKLEELNSGDYLVLAGSVPDNLPKDIYERILERTADKKINSVIDANGDLLKNALRYHPFLIKPNHIELGDLFGVKVEFDEEIIFYANKLRELGARNVLVSRASDGAILLDENGEVHKIGIAEGTLVNSVGCGDSMLAGFLAGYIDKVDYDYALKLGTACGCATAFSPQLASKDDIERVFNNHFGSE